MIRLIVTDMDGTLLKKDNTISRRTIDALIQAQVLGIKLVLASGRTYRKLMPYAKQLQMDRFGGYFIEVNGIATYHLASHTRIVHHQFQKQDVMQIFRCLQPLNLEILGMKDDAIYDYIPPTIMKEKEAYKKQHHLPDDHPYTAGAFRFMEDNRIGYPFQYQINDASQLPETLNKIAVAYHSDELAKHLPKIKALLGQDYWIGLTSPAWLEIMPKDVTKGNALKQLAKELHIEMDEIIAFGDGENDIEMIQAVGYGVVMENGLKQVKQFADHICADHEHEGIAEIIETMILGK